MKNPVSKPSWWDEFIAFAVNFLTFWNTTRIAYCKCVQNNNPYEADWRKLLYRDRSPQVPAAAFTRAFTEGFGRGDAFWVGVSFLKPDGQRYTHAITVWGVDCERDETGAFRLTALYMADSDDGRRALHRIPLREQDGSLMFDCAAHPLYGRIGDITVNNYTGIRLR